MALRQGPAKMRELQGRWRTQGRRDQLHCVCRLRDQTEVVRQPPEDCCQGGSTGHLGCAQKAIVGESLSMGTEGREEERWRFGSKGMQIA